jgi:hypothetical protein
MIQKDFESHFQEVRIIAALIVIVNLGSEKNGESIFCGLGR